MSQRILFITFCVLFSFASFAASNVVKIELKDVSVGSSTIDETVLELFRIKENSNACETQPGEYAGRGCCSHHGGECGCSNGRDVCCDGTLSPSCGC